MLYRKVLCWLIMAGFFLALSVQVYSSPSQDFSLLEINQGWEYQWGENDIDQGEGWEKWDLNKGHLKKDPNCQFLWLKVKLPQGNRQHPVLYFYGILANSLDVYLDNKVIYQSEEVDNILGNQVLRKIIIPLPNEWSNQTLFLKLKVTSNQYAGIYGDILMGHHKDLLEKLFKKELDYLILGFFFIIFSLILLAISIFIKEAEQKKCVFGLLIFAFLTGIWNIAEYDNIDLIFFYSSIWVYLDAIAILLSPAAGFYFYEKVFGPGPRLIIRRIWQFHLLYVLPYLVLISVDISISNPYTYKLLSLLYSWSVFRILFFADSLILLGTVIKNNFTHKTEEWILAGGITILSASLICKDLSLVNWGIFCCLLSFILILGYRFVTVHECLAVYSKELEEKNWALGEWNKSLEEAVASKTEELTNLLNRLEKENKQFSYQATIDPLTKIYNRLKLNQCLLEEVDKAKRQKTSLSIIMFDIDYFKEVNDKFGHLIGDHVLVTLVQAVGEILRIDDAFARWGGEEFIILAPQTNLEAACKIAERIRSQLAELTFKQVRKITCSFGVTQLLEDDSPESLVKRADDALYMAKGSGRNQVKIL